MGVAVWQGIRLKHRKNSGCGRIARQELRIEIDQAETGEREATLSQMGELKQRD